LGYNRLGYALLTREGGAPLQVVMIEPHLTVKKRYVLLPAKTEGTKSFYNPNNVSYQAVSMSQKVGHWREVAGGLFQERLHPVIGLTTTSFSSTVVKDDGTSKEVGDRQFFVGCAWNMNPYFSFVAGGTLGQVGNKFQAKFAGGVMLDIGLLVNLIQGD